MKLKLILTLALGAALAAHASDRVLTVLDDHQLAGIRGGFCPFEVCEDAPGTGVCQPEPPNANALCALTVCKYTDVSLPGLDLLGCSFVAKETCTTAASYRQCLLNFSASFCNSATDNACGVEVHSVCHLRDRSCACGMEGGEDPCPWSNCSPGL